jgi:hypothetical protein
MGITFTLFSCKEKPKQEKETISADGNDIDVFYFHMTNRCSTCLTIESEARKDIEMTYPGEVSTGKVNFTALNIEEDAGKSVGDEFGAIGQTLLIVRGEYKINITREAFLYAEGNPEKFASVIKSGIDSLLAV